MIRKFVIALFILLNNNVSEAGLIKVEFSGTVDDLYESTKNTSSTGYTHNRKTQSTMLGNPISLGDLVTGWITYDTSAPETSYSQTQTTYNNVKLYNAITSWGYSVAEYKVFESGVSESIQIWDNSDCCNYDVFYSNTGLRMPDFFTNMTFRLYDKTGTAFSSLDIPDYLDKDKFHLQEVHAGYIPNGSQDQLHWTANISTMVVTEVPEPTTLMLFMVVLVWMLKKKSLDFLPYNKLLKFVRRLTGTINSWLGSSRKFSQQSIAP